MSDLFEIIINLTGYTKYKKIILNSSFCNKTFLEKYNKIIIDYLCKVDKIKIYYQNFEYQKLIPLKYSLDDNIITLYKKMYNDMIQQKNEALQKIDNEFRNDFNSFIIFMKHIFEEYINSII